MQCENLKPHDNPGITCTHTKEELRSIVVHDENVPGRTWMVITSSKAVTVSGTNPLVNSE
jgi:hypothetical protein